MIIICFCVSYKDLGSVAKNDVNILTLNFLNWLHLQLIEGVLLVK